MGVGEYVPDKVGRLGRVTVAGRGHATFGLTRSRPV